MLEQDWLSSSDPTAMLEFVRGKVSDRKLRLFASTVSRRLWNLFEHEATRTAVEVAEAFADGTATDKQRRHALSNADTIFDSLSVGVADDATLDAVSAPRFALDEDAYKAARYAAECCWRARCPESKRFKEQANLAEMGLASRPDYVSEEGQASDIEERQALCELLRDIFGNRYGVTLPDPDSVRTPTVLALVTAIYEEWAFDRMPVLADALEEAGCTDASVLEHCRGPGPHVRGCWVVDLILGKS
jgi:hypothetical protein